MKYNDTTVSTNYFRKQKYFMTIYFLFTQDTKPNETKTSKTYKGVHFGKLTSKRSDFTGKPGPGPGEYEPYAEIPLHAENVNAREESQRYEANIPRYHEAIVKDVEKKVFSF
jgi:hypothetical protein